MGFDMVGELSEYYIDHLIKFVFTITHSLVLEYSLMSFFKVEFLLMKHFECVKYLSLF